MTEVISNASPLIVLAKAGLLWVLPRLFDVVFLPLAVRVEIEHGPENDPMRGALGATPWLREVRVDPPLSPLAAWQLGPGESEVIEYARRHPGMPALLDDRAARRAAHGLGVRVYGTLGVLVLARYQAVIPSFPDAADSLIKSGLYVDRALINDIQHDLEKRLRQTTP